MATWLIEHSLSAIFNPSNTKGILQDLAISFVLVENL